MSPASERDFHLPRISPRAAVLVPVLVALVLRLVYVFTFRHSPAFDQPIMDEAIHDGWARGQMQFMYEGVPYFRAPLYVWFLQGVYALNDGYLFVRIVQALLSVLTVGLVADLGRRLAGPLAGLAGGLLLAFCWPVIYFSGELVIVTFFSTLVVAALWCMALAGERGRLTWALAGAALLGIASIARPTALVFLPAVVWLGLRSWRAWLDSSRARVVAVVSMVGLMLLPGLALTVRNQVVAGDPVFIASQGGLNFYIGNNPQSDGRTAVVPGTSATWTGGFQQSIALAEQEAGRPLAPSEVSDHYYRKGLAFLLEEPGAAAGLYARKLRLLLGAAEQSNNKNPHFWRDLNPLLRLPVFSSWAVIFALGIVGVFLARRRPAAVPLNLFLALYAAGLLAFFINERFRTPETIVLAAFAGVPVAVVVERWREHRRGAWAIVAACLVVLTLSELDRIGFHGDEVRADAFSQYSLGNMYLRDGQPAKAAETYLGALDAAREYHLANFGEVERMARDNLVRALLLDNREEAAAQQVEFFAGAWPDDWRAELLQGRLAAYRYKYSRARLHYEKALEQNPASVEALVGVARALIEARVYDQAEDYLRRAMEVGGPQADTFAVMALWELDGRDLDQRTWRYAEQALELDPGQPQAHYVIGELYKRQNKPEAMLYHYREALKRDPHNIPIHRLLVRAKSSPEELLADESIPAPPPRR